MKDDRQMPTSAEIEDMMKLAGYFGLNYSYDQARNFIMKNLKVKGGKQNARQSETADTQSDE